MIIGLYEMYKNMRIEELLLRKLNNVGWVFIIIGIMLVLMFVLAVQVYSFVTTYDKDKICAIAVTILIGALMALVYGVVKGIRTIKRLFIRMLKLIPKMYLSTYRELRSDGMDVLTSGFMATMVCIVVILIII